MKPRKILAELYDSVKGTLRYLMIFGSKDEETAKLGPQRIIVKSSEIGDLSPLKRLESV